MNSGSFFLAEIRRIISSLSPFGTLSSSTEVTKPHWYSRSAKSRIALRLVLIAFSGYKVNRRHQVAARIPGHGQIQRLNQVGEHYAPQRPAHRLADDPLIVLNRAARLQVAQPGDVGAAFGERDRPFQNSNDLSHRDLTRFPGQ